MKKRILSLLLVVAMLAAMVVVPAYAVDGVNAEDYNNTPDKCPCGCGKAWSEINDWVEFSGNYTGSNWSQSGKTHYRLKDNATAVKNCSRFFGVQSGNNAVFDLNGYTITHTGSGTDKVFEVRANTTLWIVDTSANSTGGFSTTTANAINSRGTLKIYGGTFALSANVSGNGGVLRNETTATGFEVFGGVFDASKFNQSSKNGGAIYSGLSFVIYDGYFLGGTALHGGAVYADNTTMTIRGGTFQGNVYNNGGITELKGAPVMSELDLTSGTTAINNDLSELVSSQAKITVKAATGVPFTVGLGSAANAEKYAECFDAAPYIVKWTEDTFALYVSDEVQKEECPHCGKPVVWEEWTAAAGTTVSTEGHYRLTGSKQWNNKVTISAKVCLDMNGYDIGGTSNGQQLFWVNDGATLNICDLSDSGNSELKAYGNCDGGVAYIKGNVNIKGGTKGISLSSSAPTPGSGTPTQQGGLLRVGGNTSVVTVENCTLTGSNYAHTNGGVLHNGGTSAQITFTNCTINGSHVSSNGGAISTATGTITLNNCTVNGGQADGYGGAIAYTSNGKLNLTNTTVVDGTATAIDGFSTDGIYHSSYGGNTITDSTVGTIYTVNNGAWITFVGTVNVDELILDNDTQSTQNAKINTESLNADSSIGLTTTGDKFGNYGKFSTAGENAAALVECFTLNSDVAGLAVVANGLDLYLDYVGFFAVDAEGNETYCATLDEAKAMNPSYIKVAYQDEITVSGGETIDANGNDLTVKGTGAVTLIDTANQDYTTYGLVSLDGVTLANTESATVAGTTYYTVQDNEGYYSFHVLDSKLTSVGLKKSTGGLYYYVTFMCDDLMAANVQYFGIKYELYDAEGANKIGDTIYGVVGGELLTEDGTAGNKVEIAMGSMNNIVNGKNNDKAGLTTEEMGALKIKATPFACVYGELPAEGEPDLANDVVAFGTEQFKSMYDIFAGVNALCADSTYAALSAQMYQLLFVDWAGYDLDAWRAEFTNFAAAA